MNATPKHPSGKDFFYPVPIEGTELFWEGNISVDSAITNAKTLLTHCNQDPSQVYLQLDN